MIQRCLIALLVAALGLAALGLEAVHDAAIGARGIASVAASSNGFTDIGVVVNSGSATYYLCFSNGGTLPTGPLLGGVNISGPGGNVQAQLMYNAQGCTEGSTVIGYELTATFPNLSAGSYKFVDAAILGPDGLPYGLTPGYAFAANGSASTVGTQCSVDFNVSPDGPSTLIPCWAVGAYGSFGGPPPVPPSTPTATRTTTPTITPVPPTATATNTPIPPMATPTRTNTPVPTSTAMLSDTATASATSQLTGTATRPAGTSTPLAGSTALPVREPSTTPTAMIGGASHAGAPAPRGPRIERTFFAEGYTGLGYQEYLSLLNPQNHRTQAHVLIQQLDGVVHDVAVSLAPLARSTLNLNLIVPRTSNALEVDSTDKIVAERAIYFGTGHIVAGAAAHQLWYVPEGYVGSGFIDGLRIFNPQTVAASVTITAYQSNGLSRISYWSVASGTRVNIQLNDIAPWGGSALVIRASVPLVVESVVDTIRASGPSGAMALPAPSRTWYFPDGGTSAGNEEYITIFNPNSRIAPVHLRPVTAAGYQPPVTFHIPPQSRAVLRVHGLIHQPGLAAELDADQPIVAQEVRYSAAGGITLVNGASQPGRDWALADGYVGQGYQEWVTIFNPRTTWTTVRVRLLGSHGVRVISLREPPRHHDYLSVNALVPTGPVSVLAQASNPVVIGRTLIFNHGKGLSTTTAVMLR